MEITEEMLNEAAAAISLKMHGDRILYTAEAQASRELASDALEAVLPFIVSSKGDEFTRLWEALVNIDALDPEDHIHGFSAAALKGLVGRMGEIARNALEAIANAAERDATS